MKKLILLVCLVLVASFAQAKMVKTRAESEAIKGLRGLYSLSDSYRNEVGVAIAKIQADIAAHPQDYDGNDKESIQTLYPFATDARTKANDFKEKIVIEFPGIMD